MNKNNYPANPIVDIESAENLIMFKQNHDTMVDVDLYSRFIYSCTNQFYHSRFYREYKSYIMNLGLTRSGMFANVTSEMTDLELHHNCLELKQAAIVIAEHLMNKQGYVNTFEVLQLLEEAHRNHEIAVIIMDKSSHQLYHSSPSSFISVSQCWGRPDKFIEKYIDGMTFDIAMNLLLRVKQEYQYNGESNTPMMAKVRDEILDWQVLNGYRTQTGGIFVPFNQNYNTQQYGYGYPQQQLIFF